MRQASGLRRALFLLPAILLPAFLTALVLLLVLLGPILRSDAFRDLAERTVRRASGMSLCIQKIHFKYPLDLTMSGLSVKGETGGIRFSVYVGSFRLVSGLGGLLHGELEEVVIREVFTELELSRSGAGGDKGAPFRIPGWVWRIGSARLTQASIRAAAANDTLCIEAIEATWTRAEDRSSGALRVGFGRSADQGLTLHVDRRRIRPEVGPAVLPSLEISDLLAFAGQDLPLTGSCSGAIWFLEDPMGMGGLYLELRSDGLSMDPLGTGVGFQGAGVRAGMYVLLPKTEGQGEGGIGVFGEIDASAQGLSIGGKSLASVVQPLSLKGSIGIDTGEDLSSWDAEVTDNQGTLRVRSRGVLAGILTGQMETETHAGIWCGNLGSLRKTVSPWISLPGAFRLEGAVTADMLLTGRSDELALEGRVRGNSLHVAFPDTGPLPLDLALLLEGTIRKGRLERGELRTGSLRIQGIDSLRIRASFGAEGLRWQARADPIDLQEAAHVLASALPQRMRTFEWGGKLQLSGKGRFDTSGGRCLKGDFVADLHDAKFHSEDFQQMAEKVHLQLGGRVTRSDEHGPVEISLDVKSSGGEIVYGGFYANLARNRPKLHADLGFTTSGTRVDVRSASLEIDRVGKANLSGRILKGGHGIEGHAEADVQGVHLDGLVQDILKEGAGAAYPVLEEIAGSGRLDANVSLVARDGRLAVRGRVKLEEASLSYPPGELVVSGLDADLPFSLGSSLARRVLEEKNRRSVVSPGWVRAKEMAWKGIYVPELFARLLLDEDGLELKEPLSLRVGGGNLTVPAFRMDGIVAGSRTAEGDLELRTVELADLTQGFLGWKLGGSLSGGIHGTLNEDGAYSVEGGLHLVAGAGSLDIESVRLARSNQGGLDARLAVHAKNLPVHVLAGTPVIEGFEGTLNGDLGTVEVSGGRLTTRGALALTTCGGVITVSGIHAGDLLGSDFFLRGDVALEGLRLHELTSPLDKFGYVSGVLNGRVKGLRIGKSFPYAQAFDADLETVKQRGVPQKISATAVRNLSRIGGSNALASALSGGLYRYFDEYYYRKIGIRATLEDGWLELHGVPKGGQEYLIIRAFRLPTISMPIRILTPNRKIRFRAWVNDLRNIGTGG